MQDEPGVRRPLADPAVGDGVAAEVQAGLYVRTAERSSSSERNMLSSFAALDQGTLRAVGHAPAPLRLLLREVRRRQQPARELVGRADVDQVALADGGNHLVAQRAEQTLLLGGVAGPRGARARRCPARASQAPTSSGRRRAAGPCCARTT